jgi:putative flavoprotein involved in K+ transport
VPDPSVVVIGAGQAGLAVSHELSGAGVDHLVLERGRKAETWRGRWESFCLVTPNWTMSLPGLAYDGDEPEGFVPRDEIVRYLERYAASFSAPVREGVEVRAVEAMWDASFLLRTSAGEIRAPMLVIATGAYQRPHRPVGVGALSKQLVIDAEGYLNPDSLPPGGVLVVGSGQTGCQIAEELHGAGRHVYLACGRAPWIPRRLEGRDTLSWLTDTTFFEAPLSSLPSPAARLGANPQATGRGGGHDLHYRTLQMMGVRLLGRLTALEGTRASFADDLAESVAFGDARYADIRKLLSDQLGARGIRAPEMPDPPPFVSEGQTELKLDGVGTVIFTSGFRPDYTRWLHLPAFDEMGFPVTNDGASTAVPGVYFAGVHFLRKRKSSLLFGVGEDATLVAQSIVSRLSAGARRLRA